MPRPGYLQILFVFLLVYRNKLLNMLFCLWQRSPCMWREDSKHSEVFSFSTSCRQSATKRTFVFFIADRSVKRSVLVCWLFRRQSKKEERTEVRSYRVWCIICCRFGSTALRGGRALLRDVCIKNAQKFLYIISVIYCI